MPRSKRRGSYNDLEGIEAFERDCPVNALRGDRFWIRDSGFLTNNPVACAFSIDLDVCVDRAYAPLEEPMLAYTKYASQMATAFKTMRDNLRPQRTLSLL